MTIRLSSFRPAHRLSFLAALGLLAAPVPPALADTQPFGGIVGVLAPADPHLNPAAFRSAPVWRSLTAVQKNAIDTPLISHESFKGNVQLWLDRNDNRYVAGEQARVYFAADQGAYVQLLTIGAHGTIEWLFPADRLGHPMEPRWIEPGRPLVLPQDADSFYYRMDPPAGVSVLYGIVSSSPLPAEAREAMRIQIAEAGRTDGFAAMRTAVAGFAERYPAWRMRTVALPYEIVERPGLAPTPAPAPLPASSRPAPALPWLKPPPAGRPSLTVTLDSQAYAAGSEVKIRLRTEVGCLLQVLALGSGGHADLLFPNLVQAETLLPAGTELSIPRPGSELHLHVRGPSGREAEAERVVALCLPLDLPRLSASAPSVAAPTLSFAAGSQELAALEGLRGRLASLVVAEAGYVVGPAAAAAEPPK